MNLDQGWIKLHRKLQENPLWRQKRKFSLVEAWIDILLETRYNPAPEIIIIGLHTIECGRGQCVKSLDTWAKRWNWTKTKVHRVLNLLQSLNMISLENVTKSTRITVCNYDFYNPLRNDNETIMKRNRNASETHSEPNKNIKKVKKDNNDNIITAPAQFSETINIPFSDFWNAYDKKAGNKEKLSRRWDKLSDADRQAIMNYIPLYIRAQPDKKFRKNPETFLNNKSWNDEIISQHENKKTSPHTNIPSRSQLQGKGGYGF